jgi:hypothetical protein
MANLEKSRTSDSRDRKVGPNASSNPDKPAEEARARIEQFRRLTAQETASALEDSGVSRQAREPQEIRYSAMIQVASAMSQETLILHRKLATVLDRTQDMDIRKLLKTLHKRYLCLDVEELCAGKDIGFINGLVERANAYLAKTKLGLRIHLRNGFVLVGPEKGYEPVYVIDNEETRKTMHYNGVKIAKPANLASVPEPTPALASPAASSKPSLKDSKEAVPEAGSYLQCVRGNYDKFKGKKSEIDCRIAEAIAQAADNPGSDLGDEDGTTIHELEKTLKIADHTIAARMGKVGRIFKRMGITLDIEEAIADADMDKAAENSDENYFYRITLFWTSSLDYDSGGDETVGGGNGGNNEDEGDDLDEDGGGGANNPTPPTGRKGGKRRRWGSIPSRGNVENMEVKEDPNDIFPAFRNVKFTTAVQFNEMIVEALTGDSGICTYERNASGDDSRKLLRSLNACEVDASIKDRVEEWRRKLSLGIQRCKKYSCLCTREVNVLLRGIGVNKDEA